MPCWRAVVDFILPMHHRNNASASLAAPAAVPLETNTGAIVPMEQANLRKIPIRERKTDKQQQRVPAPVIEHEETQLNTAVNKTTRHYPNYFTDIVPLETLLQRDNMLSVFSGCSFLGTRFDSTMTVNPTMRNTISLVETLHPILLVRKYNLVIPSM